MHELLETEIADGAFAALGQDLAPGGYACLLACGGRATLAVCLFTDFHCEAVYLERAEEAFRERVGIPHGAGPPIRRRRVLSGHLAARAWMERRPEGYNRLWKRRFGGLIRAGAVNRYLYELLGNRGYGALARSMARSPDPRGWLRRRYGLSWWKRLLYPAVRGTVFPPADPAACSETGCDCTWCRCVRGVPTPEREGAPPLAESHRGESPR